ncbi:hypothetical protein EV2_002590 [Malus domestica]
MMYLLALLEKALSLQHQPLSSSSTRLNRFSSSSETGSHFYPDPTYELNNLSSSSSRFGKAAFLVHLSTKNIYIKKVNLSVSTSDVSNIINNNMGVTQMFIIRSLFLEPSN